MRDPQTDQLLTNIRKAVAAARDAGVTVRACIFDATCAAVDGDGRAWPSREARHAAENACRAEAEDDQPADETRAYMWAQTIDTADRGETVRLPGTHHGPSGDEEIDMLVPRADVGVLAAMLAAAAVQQPATKEQP